MSLSLTAEKKSLSTLFSRRDQYIIPAYQRPYSWHTDECQQLYQDFLEAYNSRTDYFVGNIILAVGEKEQNAPRVVDGQQRLITLWLMFKALSVIFDKMAVLQDVTRKYNWDGSEYEIKIKSDVIESKDYDELDVIFNWQKNNYDQQLQECYTKTGDFRIPGNLKPIIANSLFLYDKFKNFYQNYGGEKLTGFIRFILEQIFVLPIELTENNVSAAENRALTIFETINNRGMDLEDADIFKARLYSKALDATEKENFLNKWQQFRDECEALGVSVDELFRYYSHIIRGEMGVTKTETSLRDFFSGENSPIGQNSYQKVMEDLLRITNILNEYDDYRRQETELAAWLQLIEVYSNRYPKYAVITYLFKYGFSDKNELLRVLKSIVRYCYYMGSTTYVKFGIYVIIKQIVQGEPISDNYHDDVTNDTFKYLGRLKYGYALLAHYLESPVCLTSYDTDHLLASRDANRLASDWDGHNFGNHIDDLGNLVVLDVRRRNRMYQEKWYSYSATKIKELRSFLSNNPHAVSYASLKKRNEKKIGLLVKFFKSPQKN